MPQAAALPANSRKKLAKFLPIGLTMALAGAGFLVTYTGLIGAESAPPASAGVPAEQFLYVPVDPITINLGSHGESRHLRFSARLEVAPQHGAEVTRLMPRIVDVLNIYLRALDPQEIEEPAALLRLRGQMLRRVQVVAGPGLVNDLLIIEFVFN